MPVFSIAILWDETSGAGRAAECMSRIADRITVDQLTDVHTALTPSGAALELRFTLAHYPRTVFQVIAEEVRSSAGRFIELWRLPQAEREAVRAASIKVGRQRTFTELRAASTHVCEHLATLRARTEEKAARTPIAAVPVRPQRPAPAPPPSPIAKSAPRVEVPVRRQPDAPTGPDARLARRFDVSLDIEFATAADFVREHASNISRGGLFIRTAKRPPLDAVAEVKVALPTGEVLKGQAVVVHHREGDGGGVGLAFVGEDRAFADALDRYLLRLAEAPAEAAEEAPPVVVGTIEQEAPVPSPAEVPTRCGHFELLAPIGQGALSHVYRARAWQRDEADVVALKWLRPERRRDETARSLFDNELLLAKALRHPNIARVLDGGEDDDRPFLVCEWVDGGSVGELITFCRSRSLEIPLDVALHIVTSVLDALDHAHNAHDPDGKVLRIVHCDVSPMNVLVSRKGEVKLTDFGVAHARGGVQVPAARLSKPHYRSPELTKGDVTADADLWACAVLLYELLALRLPADGEGRLQPIREWAPHVPEPVELLITRALSPSRAQRFGTAAEMSRALRTAIANDFDAPLLLASMVRAAEVERGRKSSKPRP